MITINLNQTPAGYAPGESIGGTVEWTELNAKTSRVEIRLIWYTEGKGDTDFAIIETITEDSPAPTGSKKFSFVAPTRPFSFSGKLISLIWAVEVVEFPSRDGAKETLTISSDRNEIMLENSFPDDSMAKKFVRFSNE